MKWTWLLFFLAPLAYGQPANPLYIQVKTAPSGSCASNAPAEQLVPNGTIYTCQSGTWVLYAGGGAGGPYLPLAGGTMTGAVSLFDGSTSPTQNPLDNSTKVSTTAYADAAVAAALAGTNPAVAVLAASTANLTGTYVQVGGGVGDTFTITATGAFTLDGIAINTIGQRVLFKNQSTASQNGVYTATTVGASLVSPVFTRAADYNTPSNVNNTGTIPVQSGTVNATTSWLLTSQVTSIGSAGSSLIYTQFNYSGGPFLPLAGGVMTGAPTAPQWNLQSTSAGPYAMYFNDFFSFSDLQGASIGSPSGNGCSFVNTYTDVNHPGNIVLVSGTGGTGTGEVCGITQGSNGPIFTPNTSLGWTHEMAVYVPVLPGTTVGAYQAGMAGTSNANPWTTGIGFYLSSANGVANDWYCEYGSTYTDSTVAATVAWVRQTIVNDGTKVHWYLNGSEVCGTGVAIASIPSATMKIGTLTAVALSGTSINFGADYVNFRRNVVR